MLITNRRARFDYHILEEYVGGLILKGSEVKSIQAGKANVTEAYLYEKDGEIWVKNMWISKYAESSYINHDETRDRKLLLNKKEILALKREIESGGLTMIPLEVKKINNRFKLVFGLARGKKNYDKRSSLKKKDLEREVRDNF